MNEQTPSSTRNGRTGSAGSTPAIDPLARPRLATGARLQSDRLTGRAVLLFPEGMLELNDTGAAILGLCDGSRSFSDLLSALRERFTAPPDVVRADLVEYLLRLRDRRFLSWDERVDGRDDSAAGRSR